MRGRSLFAFLAGVLVTAVVALGLSVATGDDEPGARGGAAATATPAAVAGGSTRPVGVADIVERVSSGVVFVGTGQGGGSGFLIDAGGDIVTNQHVVDDARTVQVRFGGSDEAVPARVRGADASTDLALLQVAPADIPDEARPLQLAPSRDLRPGDAAIAIGSPFGLEGTVTTGVVSALDREIVSPNGFPIPGVLQTDAAINPGNSGGPLLDAQGRVIGVNSQIQTAPGESQNSGVGFAVPSDTVRDVIPVLEREGEIPRAYLGVSTSPAPERQGPLVATVAPGGPAEQAGIAVGDRIVRFDGQAVEDPSALSSAVLDKRPGEVVEVVVRDGSDERTVRVRLGDRPEEAVQP